MECWRCSQTIPVTVFFCVYCGAEQRREKVVHRQLLAAARYLRTALAIMGQLDTLTARAGELHPALDNIQTVADELDEELLKSEEAGMATCGLCGKPVVEGRCVGEYSIRHMVASAEARGRIDG